MPKAARPKEELQDIFNLFDDEGNGKICATQIGYVCRAFGSLATNAMISAEVAKVIKAGEKVATFDEVYAIFEKVKDSKDATGAQDYIEALRTLDKDETGKISGNEVKYLLMTLGEKLTEKESEDFLSDHIDSEGWISYENFIRCVVSGCQSH